MKKDYIFIYNKIYSKMFITLVQPPSFARDFYCQLCLSVSLFLFLYISVSLPLSSISLSLPIISLSVVPSISPKPNLT